MYYLLNEDKSAREVTNVLEWAKEFEESNRAVKQEQVGDWFVSTMFLGLDMGFREKIPLIFETMIFDENKPITYTIGGKDYEGHKDIYQERYSTYDEALKSHELLVQSIRDGKEIEGLYGTDTVDNLIDNA